MANRKCVLVKNVRVGDKWRLCKVIFYKNGAIKAVLFKGQELRPDHDAGEYKLRYFCGSRLCYDSCGNDPVEAVNAWRRKQILLAHPEIKLHSPEPTKGEPTIAELVSNSTKKRKARRVTTTGSRLRTFCAFASKRIHRNWASMT